MARAVSSLGHRAGSSRSYSWVAVIRWAACMIAATPRMVWISFVGNESSTLPRRRRTATSTTLVSLSKFMSQTCSAINVRDNTSPVRRARRDTNASSFGVRSRRLPLRVALCRRKRISSEPHQFYTNRAETHRDISHWPPLPQARDLHHPPQARTPTMNGFGRFLGEAVGLQAGSPGEGPEVTGRVQEGRERR